MKRSKKIIFAAHCLLNQNARAQTVAKCPGAVREFLDYCLENDYGIISIGCPQLMFETLDREPETKEFYDNRQARKISRKVAKEVVRQIMIYKKSGYQVCGIFGVEGSPTCGAVRTHIRSDEGAIVAICKEAIAESPKIVEEYKAGKERAIGAIVGLVMKKSKGKANPQMVNKILIDLLK